MDKSGSPDRGRIVMVRWLAPAFVQGVLDASPEALKAQAERAARGLQETRIPPIRRRWEDESLAPDRRSTAGGDPLDLGSSTAVLKANAMRLAAHHRRNCDGATCTIRFRGCSSYSTGRRSPLTPGE